jgi:hypothetical protein
MPLKPPTGASTRRSATGSRVRDCCLPRLTVPTKLSPAGATARISAFDDAEDLAYGPSGGPLKQWLAGAVLAAIPFVYGIVCIHCGHTTLFGRYGNNLDVTGVAGFWLAVAYIALGSFLHFHYFWGLSGRLWKFSQAGKIFSALVFVPTLLYALYRIVA